MLKEFTVNGDVGTLRPVRSGLFARFPSWVALIFALPLLFLFLATLFIQGNLIVLLFFGASSSLFFILWYSSRKLSKDAGRIRIFKQSGEASVTQRDGTEQVVRLADFRCITIAKVHTIQGYVWGAFLEGATAELPLRFGLIFRGLLIRRVSPIAEWLQIPVKVSDENKTIDLVASLRKNNTVFHK